MGCPKEWLLQHQQEHRQKTGSHSFYLGLSFESDSLSPAPQRPAPTAAGASTTCRRLSYSATPSLSSARLAHPNSDPLQPGNRPTFRSSYPPPPASCQVFAQLAGRVTAKLQVKEVRAATSVLDGLVSAASNSAARPSVRFGLGPAALPGVSPLRARPRRSPAHPLRTRLRGSPRSARLGLSARTPQSVSPVRARGLFLGFGARCSGLWPNPGRRGTRSGRGSAGAI